MKLTYIKGAHFNMFKRSLVYTLSETALTIGAWGFAQDNQALAQDNVEIDEISIGFVPSRVRHVRRNRGDFIFTVA